PELARVLVVAACRESYLLDYGNERSRFMFNFGDGAVAGLLVAGEEEPVNEVLGAHTITDGSFSLQVKVPSGGSVSPNGGYRFLDVADPAEMKGGLDEVSLPNFVAAARGAVARSGAQLADVRHLCALHMKRSMHDALVAELGGPAATYLDDTGHMSGVDSLLGLDRVRFPATVPAGSRVRASFRVEAVEAVAGGSQATIAATVEREDGEKPVCVAELLFRFLD